jgi:hypothetical protein
MSGAPVLFEHEPPRPAAPPRETAAKTGRPDHGDWSDYTQGASESLKNLNDVLTSIGIDSAFEFINEIFDKIAADLREQGPSESRQKYLGQIAGLLQSVSADKKLSYLVLLTAYHRMYAEWEGSLRHEPVHILFEAITSYFDTHLAQRSPSEQYIIGLFLSLLRILCCGMRIENALNVNCPLGILKHSSEVARVSIPEPGLLRFDEDEEIVIGWAKREIGDAKIYFGALAEISTAVVAWLDNRPDWRDIVSKVAGRVLTARDAIKKNSYFYATELEAHRATLRAMLEHGEADQSAAEYFTVIYCFPFVIRDFRPRDAEELGEEARRIFERWHAWSDSRPSTDRFHRTLKPTSLEQVELADVWAIPSDIPLTRRKKLPGEIRHAGIRDLVKQQKCYHLYAINFQDVVIHDVEDLQQQIKLRCELRLSLFGNHYLRFSAAKGDDDDYAGFTTINGHDIHRALRRASSLCGKEPISSEDGAYRNFPHELEGSYRPDGNLLEIGKKLLEALGDVLPDGMSAEHDLPKTSNVIFSLTEFSDAPVPGMASADKREEALRQLFMNPIGGPADRLEPWLSRAASPKVIKNLAKSELGDQAQIYTTANTTLIRLPSHAHFVRLDYEEMAEFVATLEPLYNYWNTQISSRMEEVLDDLRDEKVGKIETSRIGLQHVVVSAQKAMLDIESPGIVTNSVYRSYLDAFIKQSTVGALKKNFQDLTKTTQDVVNTVSDYAEKQEDKWLQRRRYLYGTIVAIVALAVSLGQLTDYKLICVGAERGTDKCAFIVGEKPTAAADNPSTAQAGTQPAKTAR